MIRYVLNTLGSFRSTLAVGIGLPFLVAASASAQAPASEATTERVIVTGSYIPTAETESALPVTVYTAEVLQKQGANTPVEGLRQLPSFVGNTATENDSNGGNGSAMINLRALGPQNTLTLINGRRTFNFSDINAIPISAVSRTEVLKDGASAVYGSDAVAGVVNFILLNGPGEKPYEGAELYALYGNTTESDAHVRQVYLKGGVTGLDGRVSIAASAEYYSRANLYSRDRFQLSGTANTSNFPGDPFYPGSDGLGRGGLNNNSPTFGGRIRVTVPAQGLLQTQLVLVDPFNNAPVAVFDGSNPRGYRRFEAAVGTGGTDPSRFNFRQFTPAIPAQEKAMYFVTGRYKIFGEGLQLYGDVMYSKTKQDNGLAPSPFTQSSLHNSGLTVNGLAVLRASPFNPFPTNIMNQLRYRFHPDEVGNRRSFYDSDYWRYVVGLNGDFNIKDNGFISRLGYDAGFVYERYDQLVTNTGDADGRLLGDEIIAGNFNPFIGQLAAVVGTAPIYNSTNPMAPNYRNGVPIGTAAYDNRAAATRALYLGHSLFFERDWSVDAKVNAHLFPNLWNGGIDVAAGYEHRQVQQHSIPDPVQAAGFQLGFNQAPLTKYRQEVDSFFGEITVPLVTSTMNVPFVRSFEVSAAYRFEQFDNLDLFFQNPLTNHISFDNGGTPRISLRYQPIADLTLRGSWGQSFRSPGFGTLFDPGSQNFPQLFDPLKAVTLQPPQGVQQFGNIDLKPEETDAYSAGVVWTPKFIPGFTMTADVYQLFTTSLILSAAESAQIMLTANGLSGLANRVNGVPTPTLFTAQVTRDLQNNLQGISDAHTNNSGKRFVEGMDVVVVYEIPTERFGKFTLSGGWNHFFIWKAEGNPELAPGFTNFLGNYNNGTQPLAPGAIPFNKAFLRGEWEWHGFDLVATGNYIGDFEDDPAFLFGNTVLGGTIANPDFALHHRVSDYETLDMQLSYTFVKPVAEPAPATYAKDAKDSKNVIQTAADSSSIWQRMLWNTKLTVGVNNVFDRYPPTVLGAFNDNYDTSLYTIRNRYWYVSLTKRF
jgi:iron complex outermembrane recepter protein